MASSTNTQAAESVRRDDSTLLSRIVENPRPGLRWGSVMAVLVLVELGAFLGGLLTVVEAALIGVTGLIEEALKPLSSSASGAVLEFQQSTAGFISGLRDGTTGIPTLLSRELIPNQGYQPGGSGAWEGTFLNLAPPYAWAIRLTLVVVYALFLAYWLFQGWLVFREHYRQADWSPTDDIIDKLRGHRWGQFGIIVLVLFLTMGLFGPAMGPTTVKQNILSPYSEDSQIQYWSEETNSVETVFAGEANFNSKSIGAEDSNVGPMTYDDYGRFHPFGTLTNGRDLFTFMMGGARISLIVTGLAIGLGTFLAGGLAMVSAFYKGTVDLGILTLADGVVAVPQLLLLIMVSAVFANHWLGDILDGGFLLAVIFGLTIWPFLWRAVRGPALQVAQEAWVDAAKSFGQRPRVIMRKHMFPYIMGYLLIYASMSAGGIIISLSALSFLGNGLGISPPTPAWGRAVSLGQGLVSGPSWHISFIPGAMIVLLVTGMNAFGDGLRDAIDPESDTGGGGEATAAGGGG
ncbi:ABC transporter permease [Haloglomus litoreum]|uniref:ABC transporter permease n=1 Tax=Haloglomus litoreum TaxID=3034026 RepID=UPI0023E7CB7E|nr:ABC transporter permease [Haloglomus sp. DT116]